VECIQSPEGDKAILILDPPDEQCQPDTVYGKEGKVNSNWSLYRTAAVRGQEKFGMLVGLGRIARPVNEIRLCSILLDDVSQFILKQRTEAACILPGSSLFYIDQEIRSFRALQIK
jgi:hypothetical protein